MTRPDAQPVASHFIDGAYLEDAAGTPIPVLYPATGETIATVHAATPTLLDRALDAATRAQGAWAATDPTERGRILRRAADMIHARNRDLSVLETLDTGKPLQETLVADATSGADALEYFGGLAVDLTGETMRFGADWAYTLRRPLGVCVGIGAWNYPTQIACWKGAPALATGNAMVFKPSEATPLCALKVAEILCEAGLPPGLFNVVQGLGEIGAALASDPRVAKVSLTGSVPTGRKVYAAAAASMKHVTMELGGKSPLIVFEDADLDDAVSGAINANFYSSGQVCSNGTRVFVHQDIIQEFLNRLKRRVEGATIGDPLDEATDFGPMTTEGQAEIVARHLRDGPRRRRDGAHRRRTARPRRLVDRADGADRPQRRDDLRARGDLRPRHVRPDLRGGGGGRRPRQRHRIRPERRSLHARSHARASRRGAASRGHLLDQPIQPDAPRHALRRLASIGHRSRERAGRDGPLHRDPDRLRGHGSGRGRLLMASMIADYVVVGAGSAGCAIAHRLAEAGKTVLVVEYGGTDAGPLIQMPGALSFPMNMARYDWGFSSEPEPHLGGRVLATPRGKVLGGSSSINGMVYVRGHARDFDHWAERGAAGWGFADVLPYFQRMESWHDGGHGGDPDWRGTSGPLHVSRGTRANPLYDAFVEAGRQAGYELTDDYNGPKQEGFGPMEQTVWKGRRWSAANAYLKPARATGRCGVVRGLAASVTFEEGRATGVALADGRHVEARAEVVIAASSINSPKLLMLSGIGPAAQLREHGIALRADRPGVGANLQDHLEIYVQMAASQPNTLFRYWNLPGKAYVGARWLFTRTGPGATNNFESAAFVRSRVGVDYPDIQYHFLPLAVRYDGQVAAEGHGFQAHVGPMRSASRGDVTLRSADPEEAPRIRFNYMSDPQDWEDFRTCIRLTREIFAQDAFAPHVSHEIQPGADVQSDAALDEAIREHAESAYHPCGTCRMGAADDPGAVVDPETRVIGVEGLRVADSSIFPRITNGNLNAPSIMVGEKASDHLLGRSLPRSNAEPWIHPDWPTTQR